MSSPATSWVWWLCRTSDMSQITQLNAHSRQIQVQLDAVGKATCWLHLLDPAAAEVELHTTSLRLDRNGTTVWSGPIWLANESSQASTGSESGQDQLQITAMDWFNILGGSSGQTGRFLHTGAEFAAMLTAPNGIAWQAENGAYSPLGVDTAVQLTYDAIEFPLTTDAAIIFDLLDRANIDFPTGITPGNIFGSPEQRNLTLQRFQNVGQQITQLVNVEAGVDYVIDPVTRQMDLYGPGASSSPSIPTGAGDDRGPGVLFSFPGNCVGFTRSRDGTQTENRVEAIGEYSVGRADDLVSQTALGNLFEGQGSLSEVVDPNILEAYAQAEVAVKSYPWTIVSFTPRGLLAADLITSGVPRPYDDFNLGDIVYARVDRGCAQIGTGPDGPQATRLFGWTLSIDDSGVEKLTNIQTTYSGAGA